MEKLMNEFILDFKNTIQESPVNAALEALTILALKNTSSEYEKQYLALKQFFGNNSEQLQKCSYIKKVMEIFVLYNRDEAAHLSNLALINKFLNDQLIKKYPKKKITQETKTFNKWWS